MPLPPAAERAENHHRRVDVRCYRRADGLFDIEGQLSDRKPQPFTPTAGQTVPAGDAVHGMWLRLTIDEQMLVHDAVAATDAAPYASCFAAPATLARLRGLRIAEGWARAVREHLGGAKGCTHLTEMLGPMASAAVQSLIEHRRSLPPALDAQGQPLLLDSCLSLARGGAVALLRWPGHDTVSRSPR